MGINETVQVTAAIQHWAVLKKNRIPLQSYLLFIVGASISFASLGETKGLEYCSAMRNCCRVSNSVQNYQCWSIDIQGNVIIKWAAATADGKINKCKIVQNYRRAYYVWKKGKKI